MSKINLYDSILNPSVTEKSTYLSEMNKVVFKVKRSADKKSVKKQQIDYKNIVLLTSFLYKWLKLIPSLMNIDVLILFTLVSLSWLAILE